MRYLYVRRLALIAVFITIGLLLSALLWRTGIGPAGRITVAAAFLCILVIIFIVGRDFFSLYFWRSTAALAVFVIVAVLSMSALAVSKGSGFYQSFDWASTGSVLILFTAALTLTGFTITITRLQEAHYRISTYTEFLVRLHYLLTSVRRQHSLPMRWLERLPESIWRRTSDEGEGLKIICTVPTLGNVSHQRLYVEYVYRAWVKLLYSKAPVDLVCIAAGIELADLPLPPKDGERYRYDLEDFEANSKNNQTRNELLRSRAVGEFYKTEFIDKKRASIADVRRAMVQAMEIICRFREEGTDNTVIPYPWSEKMTDELPPMHLFWTPRRAIVAVPLDRGVGSEAAKHGEVEVIGYETTEPSVIRRLAVVFNEWKRTMEERIRCGVPQVRDANEGGPKEP